MIDMNKIFNLLLVVTPLFIFIVCSGDIAESVNAVPVPKSVSVANGSDNKGDSTGSSEISHVQFDGNSITLKGRGAKVNGSTITITSSGTYNISGRLDNGQIIVNTKDKEKVDLILSGVDVTCSKGAPIYIINSEKTVITLSDGAKNYMTDGDSYVLDNAESGEPSAAIFSNDDLTITGKGLLTINARYNHGIQTKDDLKITGGNITVNAVNDGIKGKDRITVKGGNITVKAGGDGMQSNNTEAPGKGEVSIEGGTVKIIAGGDGIQAQSNLIIGGGNITISSGSGSSAGRTRYDRRGRRGMTSSNTGSTSVSTKGIKAGVDLTINGGTINIDSSDDSLHSGSSLRINGGNIILASGDDAMGAKSTIEINDGDINITKCYEGIESSVITINNGNIHLVSSDDGINGVSKDNSRSMGWGGRGFDGGGNNSLNINGGYIAVDAYGDGFDINGPINMTGGAVIINGPTDNMNGPLDYSGGFNITGGFIVAAGSSGMAQPVGGTSSSTQYSTMVWFSSWQEGGTTVHIRAGDGKEILTFSPAKAYSSVALSSPELKNGATYTVYSGGSSTGKVTDGLYSGGKYTPGVQKDSFTISSAVTYAGSGGSGFSRRGRW
jgi:hypothetical protein